MKFRSNECIAIHLRSLAKAERFYSDVLGLRLRSKSRTHLEYDTGHFRLFLNRSTKAQPATPSFSVKSAEKAKRLLRGARCQIVVDRGSSFYFRDPFGNVFDVVED
ncbi:MAG TPA: VOC family protein [Opitutaceae bacterium]|jgi:catechol 2,3-dioxygenase-like lactoylglutathione lyase family enzyme